MAAKRTHDIAIKVGEYEDGQGNKKGRYKNIGVMMDGENGPFLLIDATVLGMSFNYIANPKRQDKIIASLFEAKDDEGGGKAKSKGKAEEKGGSSRPDFDDEIPF